MQGYLAGAAGFLLSLGASSPANADAGPVRSLVELRQTGVVVQQWDLSCGAAALATLLRYQHGEAITEREVAALLVDRPEYLEHPWIVRARHGFSLLDLRRVARRLGYEGIGLGGLSLTELDKRAPVIVPVNLTGFPHFVIYRGRIGQEVLLADPAFGNRTIVASRFERAWIENAQLGRVGFVVRPYGLADNEAPHQGELALDERAFTMVRP
ncbi:C39 family peptidase [Qipengyuania sphaerica]|uniref:C39 family peptidase n=1 Tax=Qipengyuania sphaerica TaxID=2867243 RepID=UPI001C886B82|nr:C39 family peptidase [Qipengyuania sphaerica]MBX7539660.1 C39 family peptidase [Qipengyuania sphaerica]